MACAPRRSRALKRGAVTRATSSLAAAIAAALCLLSDPADAADKPGELWPAAVHARYRLRFLGVDVGHLEMTSSTSQGKYSLAGSGKVSVLLGAVVWSGTSSASGIIENSQPAPTTYVHEVRNKKKSWAVQVRTKDHAVPEVTLTPPPGEPPPDFVPVTAASKVGALDPFSAVMMLTRADGRPPCARRLPIFDGKQRYDLVFAFKRMTRLPLSSSKSTSEVGVVCRVTYEPIGGHRANDDTKAYAANRDVEVILRRIPGTEMMIPYSVIVPTAWGTGSMTAEHIEVTTGAATKITLAE